MKDIGQQPRFSGHGLAFLANREAIGSDGWIHIVPKGELKHAECGVTQVLDDPALDSILGDLRNKRGGLYLGEEHFIYDDSRSSEAFAWCKDFEMRADGIWGKPELTDLGEPALKNKRFKFTSFVCDPNQPGAIEKLDGNRLRILKIDTVGFTNFPNGRHLLQPISNRFSREEPGAPDAETDKTKTKTHMKLIAQKLGLSAEASEDACLGELAKLLNRATKAEADLNPITTERDLLKNRMTVLLDEQIDADLDAHGVDDETKRKKLHGVLSRMENRAERIDFLALIKPEEEETKTEAKRLTNRGNAQPPSGKAQPSEKGADADKVLADKIKNRAAELKGAAPTRPFNDCWTQAQNEIANAKK